MNDEVHVEQCRHVTGKIPRSVSIVAMGPTKTSWQDGNGSYNLSVPRTDEVWTLNKGLRTLKADVGFVLDDLVGEARKSSEYAADLRKLTLPIITSTIDHDVRELFPDSPLHAFPAQEIIWELGIRYGLVSGNAPEALVVSGENIRRVGEAIGLYQTNSVPMMLSYALWIGVTKVYLYGADYTFPGQAAREEERACAEYWVGFCRGQGMEIQVSPESTLLNERYRPGLYGYGARPPVIGTPTPDDVSRILRHLGVD